MKYLFVVLFFVSSFVFAEQQYKTHRVSSGETVESIAKEYGVPVDAIYRLNPDARKGISASTTLIIPADAAAQAEGNSFKTHKVKSKETLYSISREYNISIDDIKRYNKFLYAEPLRKGDKLRIPPSTVKAPAEPVATGPAPEQSQNATREHTVLPQETMYGISKEYGLTVEELTAMNPWVDTLQPGMMLTIELKTNENTSEENKNFRLYEVQPKETMYSLTREFNISRDSLIALNPSLRDGLKAGMQLKLPKENNTNTTNAEYFSSSVDLESQIENRDPKNLVLMLPFNLDKIDADSTDIAKERIRKDQVLQISLDFYSGVLLAIDSAKTKGISVNLKVLDSKQNPAHISSLINSTDFYGVDAVIGPLLHEPAEAAAMALRQRSIPVISPFSNKEVRNISNYVQTRPTKERMEEAIVSYIRENAEGRNVIIVTDNAGMRSKLTAAIPSARIVSPTNGSVSSGSLSGALDKGRENWILVETSSIGLLSSLTSRLNSMRDSYNISLFTTDRNKAYDSDSVSNIHLSNLNLHYPSVDKEYDQLRNKDFIAAYRELYGLEPNQYAVRGFDITYDILLRLAVFDSVYNSFERFDGTTEYAENKFHYQKMDNGGFYNNALYIIRLDKNLKRNVVR